MAAVLAVPSTLIAMLVQAASPSPSEVVRTSSVTHTTTFDWGAFGGYARLSAATAILGALFSILITCALARAISNRYLGRSVGVLEAYRQVGVGGFLRVLGALLLAFVASAIAVVGVGFVSFVLVSVVGILAVLFALLAGSACLIGTIYLLVSFVFVPQVIVLEHTSVRRAFRRSWTLVRGSWWRVLGIWLLLAILVAIVQAVAVQVLLLVVRLGWQDTSSLGYRLISQGLSGVVSILSQPVQLGALTLLYYDLRIRREGFDLEYMAEMLDRPAGSP